MPRLEHKVKHSQKFSHTMLVSKKLRTSLRESIWSAGTYALLSKHRSDKPFCNWLETPVWWFKAQTQVFVHLVCKRISNPLLPAVVRFACGRLDGNGCGVQRMHGVCLWAVLPFSLPRIVVAQVYWRIRVPFSQFSLQFSFASLFLERRELALLKMACVEPCCGVFSLTETRFLKVLNHILLYVENLRISHLFATTQYKALYLSAGNVLFPNTTYLELQREMQPLHWWVFAGSTHHI